jgi:hypothetical protein
MKQRFITESDRMNDYLTMHGTIERGVITKIVHDK